MLGLSTGIAWPAGVSGDPGGSGVVGVGKCTGCGCDGALGVGSVCCARGASFFSVHAFG